MKILRELFVLLSVVTVVCLAGCATPLTKQGAQVRMTNQYQEVAQCKFLGQIESSSHWGGSAATGVAFDSAMNQLKNKASQMGGDTIKTQMISNTMGGTRMVGDVYSCKRSKKQ
jgi:uncharacterized protein YceK